MATSLQLILIASFLVLLTLGSQLAGAAKIGVCYRTLGTEPLPAEDVVSMYQEHHFGGMRLYEPDPDALHALRDSGIDLIVGVQNEELMQLATASDAAQDWVQNNVMAHWPAVQFRYIAAGNEAIGGMNAQFVEGAMINLQKAISMVGLDQEIKVSTSVATSVLSGSNRLPSMGAFSPSTRAHMESIARFLAKHDAPLLANVYPYFTYVNNKMNIPLSYALFTSEKEVVKDGQFTYNNLFDATVDSLYAALEKVGAPNVRVLVSETGWPSAGNSDVATMVNAKTYMSNLIRRVSSGWETPRRPGEQIETYMFTMFNQTLSSSGSEHMFGLFYDNKEAVYDLPLL